MSSVTLECLATRYGLGQHVEFVVLDIPSFARVNEFLFVGEFFGIIGIAIAKTSFCITLLRLAVARWHKILIWVCIITVNGFMWPCGITFFVGCDPIAKKWNPTLPGHCTDDTTPVVYYAVFASGMDSSTLPRASFVVTDPM